jgi:2-amino-4-hydroxy-6-hydroxymethyldihydropteridine diphosphokinase
MPLAYILLGSNLGDKQHNLQQALITITTQCGLVVKHSSIYQTEAWGVTDQPSYLNQVIIIDTITAPQQLLKKLLQIENDMGRVRTQKYASRIIDIDILFYGREIVDTETLKVPHPQIAFRKFVLEPLNEIVPNKMHPILLLPIKKLLQQCTDNLMVKILPTP